jgi:NADH:ubiquinone oxidoreductase subunit F (NADH-binding)/NADH:ubiquinone oxidoreductase subunit E
LSWTELFGTDHECDDAYLSQVAEIASAHADRPDNLVMVLNRVQALRNYLPRGALRTVAHVMGLPESRVYGVATFYSMLSTKPRGRHIIRVCTSTPCHVAGAREFLDALTKELGTPLGGTTDDGTFTVETSSCLGLCHAAPAMMIDEEVYGNLVPSDLPQILQRYKSPQQSQEPSPKAKPNSELAAHPEIEKRVVLENVGRIDPESIEDYIAHGGYAALAAALKSSEPQEVLEAIKSSGLRGRGGASFPTGKKLEFVAKAEADQKYIVCNADEGEPGTFKDRAIMEGDPHKVIEGMAIMGYAVGATRGVIYIRGEYSTSIKRIQRAIEQARSKGMLGSEILGTKFDFDIELKTGAGAYVCGEETALLESAEGKRGEPRQKPPYPGMAGLFGKPTGVFNVETIANIPPIILNGPDWFRKTGTPGSPGTKVFLLVGDVCNRGLIEAPLGITLRDLIYKVGGGIPGGRCLKMVQTGGTSGGCLTEAHLDTPLDYDSMQVAGSTLGSGALLVVDDSRCVVDLARSMLAFFEHESCGQCTPCREGMPRLLRILDKMCAFRATAADLDLAMELAEVMYNSALCALGQSAAMPLRTIIEHFGDEVKGHLNGVCATGTCSSHRVPSERRRDAHV